MNEARLGADVLGEARQERDHVVLHLALDLVDARDVEAALLPDRLGGFLGNDALGRERVAGMRLDLEPDAEPVLRLPDGAHLRPAVARDHGDCLSQRLAGDKRRVLTVPDGGPRLLRDGARSLAMTRLGMMLTAAMMAGASVSAQAKMALETYPVPAGSGAHDVYPAPDGTVWFTAQAAGKLGRLDPKTGKS